ncbi:MAG: ABC transporter substrate-binding protein, partial [Bacillus sp. (in: firmicutes)]
FKAVDENLEVSQHGQSITFEYILEKNPDVIFVIDRSAAVGGEVGAKETIENELVKKTNAYKNGKIIYLVIAGLRSGFLQIGGHSNVLSNEKNCC